jgi:enterochelin esterase-like enzyme
MQMGLTSGSFLILMIGAAVAGLAAVIWFWPRAAGRKIWHLAARLAMVAVSEVLVIAAFLVYLNGYFSFYASWSQLLGSGTPTILRTAKTANSRAPVLEVNRAGPAPAPGAAVTAMPLISTLAAGPGGISTAALSHGNQKELARTGELLGISINGPYTGIAVSFDYVYLPPQYFQPAYAHARFPAVLALTGYPGSPWSIVKRLRLPATGAQLVAARKILPAVYVMMNVSVAMPRDTECTNVPAGPQVAAFFAQDVPRAVEQAFRVQSGPHSWAALGYSTGGFCAVKIAMMYPRQFSLAVSIAGYYQAMLDSTTGDLYGGSVGYRNENSPDWRLRHLPAPPISVLVTSSLQGERTYPGTAHFVHLARPPMRVYTLYLRQGGHNFHSWDRELPQVLGWLSQRLQPAVPQGTALAELTPVPPAPHHASRPARHPQSGTQAG